MYFKVIISGLTFLGIFLIVLIGMMNYLKKRTPSQMSIWNYKWMLNGRTTSLCAGIIAAVLTQCIMSLTGFYSSIMGAVIYGVLGLLHLYTFVSQNKRNYLKYALILIGYYVICIGFSVYIEQNDLYSNLFFTGGILFIGSIAMMILWIFLNRYVYFQGNKIERD